MAPERLVFLDESAVLTSMARRYGRSPRGQRATAKVPFGAWFRSGCLWVTNGRAEAAGR
jgi:hypothetical protein